MTSKKNKARVSKADLKKPGKKKPNVLDTERISYVDYKDINLLQRFMSDRSKIRGQKINGTTVQQQRELANAVKNAREMALLPYTKRVASVGRGPRRGPASDGANERAAVAETTELVDQVEGGEVETNEDEEA